MSPVPTQADNEYLTPQQAGEFLALSYRTLEKMRTIGGGPPFHKFGRRVSYSRADLREWAKSRKFDSTSDPEYQALCAREET